jgi:uncharacterized protein (TIGR02646 family)
VIKVERSSEPRILVLYSQAWTSSLLSAAPGEEETASIKYRHKSIRKALIAMFNGKCAYCESKILHVDFGHIEHFRPKSKYKNLTFTWDNLFLACGVCNSAGNKGVRFPLEDEGGPPINPCVDNPSEHLRFIYDQNSGIATVGFITKRGEISVELYGLNRYELRSHRSNFVKKLYVLSKFAPTKPEAKALLDAAIKNDSEYSAFARSLF